MRAINTLSFPDADDPQGVDLAHIDAFTIGPVTATPYELTVAAGVQSIHLEPKVMKVLVALSLEPGRVLSRDDLIKMVWEGRIVGDASINRVVSHLRAALHTLAEGHVEVETLPRVGYRLNLADETEFGASRKDGSWGRLTAPKWLAAAVLLVGALALALAFWPRGDAIGPINIVMLPIEPASPEDEFSAMGFASQLRDELAESGGLTVSNSPSAAQMAEEGRSPREIAQALNADFVVGGEFASTSGHQTVTLSMYTREGDSPIWMRELANESEKVPLILSRARREIRGVTGLDPLGKTRDIPLSREEYSQFILARGIVRSGSPDNVPVAEQILERLVAEHGNFVPGLIELAYAQQKLPYPPGGSAEEIDRRWERTGELLDRALALEPKNARALGLKGFYSDGEVEERLAMLNRSLEIDPAARNIMQMRAVLSLATGRAEQALETYERIIEFDPLWLRAPQAHDMAIELGRRDLARQIMQRLRAIVKDPNQIRLLDAAEARARGDLSEAYRILGTVDNQASHGQRLTTHMHKTGIEHQLGVVEELGTARPNLTQPFQYLLRGTLPSKATLERLGFTTEQFWGDEFFREYAPRLMVSNGRSADLVAYYDEFASSPKQLLTKISNGSFDYRTVSPYLALALREVGRLKESAAVLKLAEQIDRKFTSYGQQNMAELMRSAQLYAVSGRETEALANLLKAREMGWPFNSSWLLSYPYAGKLAEDPAFAVLRDKPRFRDLSANVENERRSERNEVLALPPQLTNND